MPNIRHFKYITDIHTAQKHKHTHVALKILASKSLIWNSIYEYVSFFSLFLESQRSM